MSSGTIKGEGDIIATYLAPLARKHEGALGLADDCAVLSPRPGTDLVLTTDAIAAGVHFLPDDAPEDIAWKALAVNVSDLAAKGATPLVYQMALSFPELPSRETMERLSAGLQEAQDALGIVLSGGDTDRRPGPLTITIVAIGELPSGTLVKRSGARPGDRLFVSGTLGDSAFGLKLRRGDAETAKWNLTDEEKAHLVGRYLRPRPRLDMRPCLTRWATAAMDLSDGLAKDLGRMASLCGAGAEVEIARLPLSPAAGKVIASDGEAIEGVLAGGDDYEILFTVAPKDVAAVNAWTRESGIAVTEIGAMTEGSTVTLRDANGKRFPLLLTGWDHF